MDLQTCMCSKPQTLQVLFLCKQTKRVWQTNMLIYLRFINFLRFVSWPCLGMFYLKPCHYIALFTTLTVHLLPLPSETASCLPGMGQFPAEEEARCSACRWSASRHEGWSGSDQPGGDCRWVMLVIGAAWDVSGRCNMWWVSDRCSGWP